jgi:histidinol-phosphate aminotransferase
MRVADARAAADGAGLVRPEIRALRAYQLTPPAGAPPVAAMIRLHQNEAPEDWPEAVKREVTERLIAAPWHHYPSARADELREAIAGMQGTPAAMIAATAGSNEAVWAVCAAFASRGTVVMPSPTYTMARTLAVAAGARIVEVPLGPEFGLDADAVLRAAHAHRAELIYLASPNNPTGNAYAREAVEAVIAGAPGAVIIDEAYWEFTRHSHLDAPRRAPHVLVARTFSKAMASASLRIGWITAQESVIGEIHKVIAPYALNLPAQIAGPVLVKHRDIAGARVRTIATERQRITQALQARGLRPYPSETNFVLFEPGAPPARVWQALAVRGILVRDVSAAPRLSACLRVSIGTPAANDRFLAALADAVVEARA